jgi:hypothetical protein
MEWRKGSRLEEKGKEEEKASLLSARLGGMIRGTLCGV